MLYSQSHEMIFVDLQVRDLQHTLSRITTIIGAIANLAAVQVCNNVSESQLRDVKVVVGSHGHLPPLVRNSEYMQFSTILLFLVQP